jgi:integrase
LKQFSLGDYIFYWYMTYKYPKHAQSTATVTLNHINTHILPSPLGNMDMDNIGTKDIQQFLTDLLLHGNKCHLKSLKSLGRPLSHWTVNKIRQMLISAFSQGIKEGVITRNYAAETEPIPIPYSDKTAFSLEYQREFLKTTKNHRFYAAYVLLFYSGCRRSEILGLSWNNINWKENYIYINQTLIIENGKPTLKKK